MAVRARDLVADALNFARDVAVDRGVVTPYLRVRAEPVRRDATVAREFNVGKPVRDGATYRREPARVAVRVIAREGAGEVVPFASPMRPPAIAA